jgi:DNA-binding LytR/AlgR family response regulator
MIPLRVLVCDDEPMARKRALRIVSAVLSPDHVDSCASGQEALHLLAENDYDVLLLDVDMPQKSGLDVARQLPAPAPHIVFLTAHPQHAVEAFNVGAVDYVLKPLEEERLRKALDRVSQRLHDADHLRLTGSDPAGRFPQAAKAAKLAIPEKSGVVLLDVAQVVACVLEDELVHIHASGTHVLSTLSLAELQAKLPHLERVHRKALLNLDLVTRLESLPSGGYLARDAGGLRVEVSRQAARVLRKRFGLA